MKIFNYAKLLRENNTLKAEMEDYKSAKEQSDREKQDMYALCKQKDAKIKELKAEIKKLKEDKRDLKKENKELKKEGIENENVD